MSIMFNVICINEEMLPIYIYIYTLPTGVELSGEGSYSCHSYDAKLFEWIEHSGIR